MDKNMSYQQKGGLRIGSSFMVAMNMTWPLAHITIGQNAIQIKTLDPKPYTFNKNEITSLRKYRGFISAGLRIEHNQKGTPPFIVFWSFNLSKLISELRKMDYSITK
jgi:hypothetical protein